MFEAYLGHHRRFLAAAIFGLVLYGLLPVVGLSGELRLVVAVDGFFVAYLGAILALSLGSSADRLRARAKTEDEGILLISGLTVLAIGFSLVSILTLLNTAKGPGSFGLVLAILSVPLGWLTLHAMAAQHYADLFYRPDGDAPAGGLDIPGTDEPESIDFLYFSFVIGMTAQTADVSITSRPFRRAVLAHSIASFLFNTVLVAVAVNAAIGGAG